MCCYFGWEARVVGLVLVDWFLVCLDLIFGVWFGFEFGFVIMGFWQFVAFGCCWFG